MIVGPNGTGGKPVVVAEEKLDRLDGRIGDLAVLITEVAGNVRTVLGQLKSLDEYRADHEGRLRVLEARSRADHETRIHDLEQQLQVAADVAKDVESTVHDHAGRLRSMERWRWLITGGAAVISAAVGALAGHLKMIGIG
jgi:hypothetical protein